MPSLQPLKWGFFIVLQSALEIVENNIATLLKRDIKTL